MCACSVVEDEVRMAAAMHRALRGAGVVADVAFTGDDAPWMVRAVPAVIGGAGAAGLRAAI